MSLSRRHLLSSAAAVPLIETLSASPLANTPPPQLKILVAGGHPGDPECGCAGTIARFAATGSDVVLLYLNRGEGFCKGSNSNQCAAVRTQEAINACRLLGARPAFAGQIDGQAIVDNSAYDRFRHVVDSEKPDVIFAQWPIDNHRDHRALSLLALDCWLKDGRNAAFYYYEVFEDTMMFSPTEYVDISSPAVTPVRRAACYAHASQQPGKWFPGQLDLTRFRGSQSGYPQAEAFVRHWQSRRAPLP